MPKLEHIKQVDTLGKPIFLLSVYVVADAHGDDQGYMAIVTKGRKRFYSSVYTSVDEAVVDGLEKAEVPI